MSQYIEIASLDRLMDGAVTERFHNEFSKLLDNIYDPNTEPKETRKITLTVSVKPDKNRDTAAFSVEVKTALAPPTPLAQTVFIHQNDDGSVIATEHTNVIPGQTTMSGDTIIPNVIEFRKKDQA